MKRAPGGPTPPDLDARIDDLIRGLPPHSELAHVVAALNDSVSDEAARDRNFGILGGTAVEAALRHLLSAKDADPPKRRQGFRSRILRAQDLGLVSVEERDELDRIRRIRDIFAHALLPLGFEDPTVREITDFFWDHPVGSWAEYFLPAFAPRHRFVFVCGAFIRKLVP
jgi:hypothetical protein